MKFSVIKGNIRIKGRGLPYLIYQIIDGSFNYSNEEASREVGGYFYCKNNKRKFMKG